MLVFACGNTHMHTLTFISPRLFLKASAALYVGQCWCVFMYMCGGIVCSVCVCVCVCVRYR